MSDRVESSRQSLRQRTAAWVEEVVLPGLVESPGRVCGFDRARLREAAAMGLTGVQIPVALGGLGLDFSDKAELASLLAEADFGFALSLINTHGVAWTLQRWLAPEIAERWLPGLLSADRLGCTALTEPGVGSDFGAISTLARRDGEGWILDGHKAWIINAVAADVVVVYAQTEPGTGARGIAGFVVDATQPGFERGPPLGGPWAASAGVGGFRLEGYRARAEDLIHPPGQAFRRAMESINGARTYVAAMCCGMLRRGIRIALEYGTQRNTFGRPLAEHQGWRWPLVDAEIELQASEALVQQACRAIDASRPAERLAAQCKIAATRAATRHLPHLLHALGAAGLDPSVPLARHVQAAQMASLVDGSTEMLMERVFLALRTGTT
jgi:alkylation response protein AidB-like acyl-CoA dehydrogenase